VSALPALVVVLWEQEAAVAASEQAVVA